MDLAASQRKAILVSQEGVTQGLLPLKAVDLVVLVEAVEVEVVVEVPSS